MKFSGINYKSTKLENCLVNHSFFSKLGGVSKGNFESLNCSIKSADQPKNIGKNLFITSNFFKLDASRLKLLNQQHTDDVVTVKEYDQNTTNITADALVTNTKNVILGVYTADCAPILFYDNINKIIGATHAGWRGAAGKIIDNTIITMEDLGATRSSITAAIGPCISQSSYEVDSKFKKKFIDMNSKNDKFFIPSITTDHFMFDLKKFCRNKLNSLGIKNIDIVDIDTYPEEHNFFSCRRAKHRNQSGFGCQLSAICL